MKHVFLLSKENIELAKAEVLALFEKEKAELIDNLLFLDVSNVELADRLAYTNKVYSLLFSCSVKDLKKNMQGFAWGRVYERDFCLRANTSVYSEAELAGYIWRAVKKPRVNLRNPKTKIELFFNKNRAYCCLLKKELKRGFSKRKAHLRPGFAPTSMNPKLACCLVNLTGIKKGSLVDCFCGSGGILIEAGLIGLSTIGYDIDKAVLDKCRQNLEFYKIKNYELINKDTLKIKKKINYLATDLPYGRSAKVNGKNLNHDFLKMLKKNLKCKAVVVFPDNVNCKKLIKCAGLHIEKGFDYYIHRSLTKKILVISNGLQRRKSGFA